MRIPRTIGALTGAAALAMAALGALGLSAQPNIGDAASQPEARPAFALRSGRTAFTVERTINVPKNPHGVEFSPDGRFAYVACAGDNVVAVVDTQSHTLVRTVPAGSTPLDVFLAPGGGELIATQFHSDALVRVPLDGSGPKKRIDVSLSPSLFSREIRGKRYLSTEFGDRVFEIDASGKPTRSWPTGKQPYPADATSDGILLFAPSRADGSVSVIDTLNDKAVATIPVGDKPEGGAVTLDDVSYVVASGGSNEIQFINTASFEVVDTITAGVGPRPFSVAMTLDGRFAVIGNAGGESVSILDLASRKVVGALKVGAKPIAVRMHPDGERIYVSSEGDHTLTVIRMRTTPERLAAAGPTEIAVLGMIHGGHRSSERYSIETIKDFIRAYKPDYILTEIPPNRFDAAMQQWRKTGEIVEPRVRVFPECTDAVFPLLREMTFTIVPTAGWTAEMNAYRSAAMENIASDPARQDQMREHRQAMERMRSMIEALGPADDPRVIHSPEYDEAIDAGYGGPYNRYFNSELADGGWDNINAKHYDRIARFLDSVSGSGKRVLIMYGAAHKGWFLKQLRQRTDARILDPRAFFATLGG